MATMHAPPGPALTQIRPPATRPRFIDYLFVWLGVGLSALFAEMADLRTVLRQGTPTPALHAVLHVLPAILFLPVGVILFWPIFYVSQWLSGRRQTLTIGEWLLGLAWLAAIAFSLWCVLKGTGNLPEFLSGPEFKKYAVLAYILFMLSVGALAAVIWLVGLVARWQQPWTHTLSLALMVWPALPLLAVWLGNIKLE